MCHKRLFRNQFQLRPGSGVKKCLQSLWPTASCRPNAKTTKIHDLTFRPLRGPDKRLGLRFSLLRLNPVILLRPRRRRRPLGRRNGLRPPAAVINLLWLCLRLDAGRDGPDGAVPAVAKVCGAETGKNVGRRSALGNVPRLAGLCRAERVGHVAEEHAGREALAKFG
jgi:hypothetical protein